MSATNIYDQLVALCLPQITAYQNDLLIHDKNAIEANPGKPFLHWTRESGTTLIFLEPAQNFPKASERVKYLFGTADRTHLLNELVSMAKYHTNAANGKFMCHCFNGSKLVSVTNEKAVEIAKSHADKIRAEWGKAENAERRFVANSNNRQK